LPGGKWKRKTEDRGAIRGGLRGLDKAKRLGEKQARVAAPNQPDQVKLLSTEKEELTLPGGRLTKKKKGGNASSAGIRGQDLPLNRTEPTTAQLGATGSWEIGSSESGSWPTVNCADAVEALLATPNSTNAIQECRQWGIPPEME